MGLNETTKIPLLLRGIIKFTLILSPRDFLQSLSRHSERRKGSKKFLTFIFHWIYKYTNEFKNHWR
ncbi:MAG: hypothetical protein A2026_09275 [Deltaproteobacteria bacterium RBG_19FT_COMBO_46_12]|nr:MAG: hypothetical protein A2026_09275 [Deltaproteobacteria bacterium RBG_19FT_COMBO_46_12]